ncbi:hypothetical protein RFI_20111 [Reticulomyxa filosa]|uniref:Uncharacterized protein n=1 Tax=Reticulomyxa filosa TaxID=46433 RepID=X6MTP6_RETFI|nr:hypothetical protein RFI_20111 [Reticulomyxa filosa]|eukprot:ETO17219.1 hypothetical protein RFI_20111 [Reticulomyxa filosa]
MPSLPSSEFWGCFDKYYNFQWLQRNGYDGRKRRTLSLPLRFFGDSGLYSEDDAESLLPIENWHLIKSWQYLTKHSITSIVGLSILLCFICLLVPLQVPNSDNDPNEVNLYLFLLYLQMYQLFSYPLILMIADYSLPNVIDSILVKAVILPLITQTVSITYKILYVTMTHNKQGLKSSFNRTMGSSVQAMIVYTCFMAGCIYKHCYYKDSKQEEIPKKQNDKLVRYSFSDLSEIELSKTNDKEAHLLSWENDEMNNPKKSNRMEDSVIIMDLRYQSVISLLLLFTVIGSYYWCEYLTWQWNSNDGLLSLSSKTPVLLYSIFWLVMQILRFLCKRTARLLDRNKLNAFISVEICMEFLMSCFYYVFYRNLFLHVSSIKTFIIMKFCHILFEMVVYPIRMTKQYFNITCRLQNAFEHSLHQRKSQSSSTSCCFSNVCGAFFTLLYDTSTYEMWCVRLSIDYTLRYIISVGSGIAFLMGLYWAKYGYNRHFLPLDVNDEQFQKTTWFVVAGMVIEVVLYIFVDWLCIRKLHMEMMRYWSVLVYYRPQYLFFMVAAAQHVMTDVIVAKLQVS